MSVIQTGAKARVHFLKWPTGGAEIQKCGKHAVRYWQTCGRSAQAPFINVSLRPEHSSCSVVLRQPHLNMSALLWAKHTCYQIPARSAAMMKGAFHICTFAIVKFLPAADVTGTRCKSCLKAPSAYAVPTERDKQPSSGSKHPELSPACLPGNFCKRIISVDMDY